MRWTTLGVAVAIGSNCADAVSFPRSVHGKGYLSVPVGTVDKPKKTKRDEEGTILTVLENMDFFYATELEIGEPPQKVTVLVDTGSNELWVNPDCDTAPTAQQVRQCNSFGHYDPRKSETPPIGPFGSETINYGDASDPTTHTSATIRYYTDNLVFGDAELQNQTFGVVTESDGISQGIMGLAPDLRAGFDSNEPYSMVLTSMADQGLINSRVFSLDLRHSDAETGAIIYGGLDRNKFIGNLEAVPIIRGESGEYRLAVKLSHLGVTFGTDSEEFDLDDDDTNVMLDSGTTITRMHYSAARPILEALNAQDDGEGFYVTECSNRESNGGVDFGFGNKIVRVPFSDFILDVGNEFYCYIGIVVTTDQQILGDSVLRAGYFVFDWDNEEVHVAQAANCGDDDIVAVGSGRDAVPSESGNCKESDARVSGLPTGTRTNAGGIDRTALPTSAYTTTYTITSCPLFDLGCQTGVVTTQTVGPAAATVTVTGSPNSDGDGDDDNAASQSVPMGLMFAVAGAFALGANLL